MKQKIVLKVMLIYLLLGFVFGSLITYGQYNVIDARSAFPEVTEKAPSKEIIEPIGGTRDAGYQNDDGISENLVRLYSGGDMLWLNNFNVIPGAETITEIHIAWGSPAYPGNNPPLGSPVRLILYEDPTDDGDPIDAVYLIEVPTIVQNVDLDFFNVVPIPPTLVTGGFFVAALYQNQLSGQYPASFDETVPLTESWLAGESVPFAIDVFDLTANSVPPERIGNSGLYGNWMLRAYGVSAIPTPSVPLSSIWIIIAAIGISGVAFFKFRRR